MLDPSLNLRRIACIYESKLSYRHRTGPVRASEIVAKVKLNVKKIDNSLEIKGLKPNDERLSGRNSASGGDGGEKGLVPSFQTRLSPRQRRKHPPPRGLQFCACTETLLHVMVGCRRSAGWNIEPVAGSLTRAFRYPRDVHRRIFFRCLDLF